MTLLMLFLLVAVPLVLGDLFGKMLAGFARLFDAVVKPAPKILEPRIPDPAPGEPVSFEERLKWNCSRREIEAIRRRYPEKFPAREPRY